MTKTILIANRGEIACRIIRSLHANGHRAIAIYSDADRGAPHVRMADIAVRIGEAPAAQSYLQAEHIIKVALEHGANGIHPGYGFLSENTQFAEAVEAAGLAFLGPTPQQIKSFGLKHEARALAEKFGVPLTPSSGLLESVDEALSEAGRIGYPVMLKSTAGGGGIGMSVCHSAEDLTSNFESVRSMAANNFADNGVFVETFVSEARHIEVQIFGDGQGKVLTLGERDCSLQRRNQKVIEEAPAPNLPDAIRAGLHQAARQLGEAIAYRSAGTVEFLYDVPREAFYFLELNSRLQVEHGVTELITGVDLVDWMVALGVGALTLPDQSEIKINGAAIEARLYAEDPFHDFRPSTGTLMQVSFPETVRVDTGIEAGQEVSPYYDPMLAKLLAFAETREEARTMLIEALEDTKIFGVETNKAYAARILDDEPFKAGTALTKTLSTFSYQSTAIDVIGPGAMTSVQDWPGRQGLWHVGVPPSGPMDGLSFRLANRLVGNEENAPGLEITVQGPALKFRSDTVIALCGAPFEARLDDQPIDLWAPVPVKAGQMLTILTAPKGQRAALAVRGGIAAPQTFGSAATFAMGKFGGPFGRVLRAGDVLHCSDQTKDEIGLPLYPSILPVIDQDWVIRALPGPHTSPDFFTDTDIETLYDSVYEVHYNSDRTGVRLMGPKPDWARPDGGEAGLHPSNIHDNAYAVGTLDFTGDMPILLGPDGPSLGGFVCPLTVIEADLWILGQLRPGDKVRFKRISHKAAIEARLAQDQMIETLSPSHPALDDSLVPRLPDDAIVFADAARDPALVIRRSGEDNVLIEYGPLQLDLALRARIQALYEALKSTGLAGLKDLTPGIRSLQVQFDSMALPLDRLVETIVAQDNALPDLEDMVLPSRIVHLPLSWDDPEAQKAALKYQETTRPDAPWCPSNIEFIRRINGLETIEEVKRVVFDASYLVLGLGDVYLGAPVATPVDPRHRLVTTKYNPARPWTPENAVGIGGAYLCIYGMEGPGGYQLVGRTIQMWNSFRQTDAFTDGHPWLLRFFDQIRFYEVSAEELAEARTAFPLGQYPVKIEETEFSFKDYLGFLADNRAAIDHAKARQQKAFEEERARWAKAGIAALVDEPDEAPAHDEIEIPEGSFAVTAPMAGAIWRVSKAVGDAIEIGDAVLIEEAMKMEVPVPAPMAGTVSEIFVAEGDVVTPGQVLAVVTP